MAVVPQHRSFGERDHLDGVLLFLLGDHAPEARSEEGVVVEAEREARLSSWARVDPPDVLSAVHEKHPVVAPVGDEEVPRDRARGPGDGGGRRRLAGPCG